MATNRHPLQARVDKLEGVVEMLDGLSQEGFGQVAALARLALSSLEMRQTHQSREDLATTLDLIVEVAGRYENYINGQAEEAGCQHVNTAARKREAARYAAISEQEAVHV